MKCVGTNGIKNQPHGFVVTVEAAPGSVLLGGVKRVVSSPFCSRKQAGDWRHAIIEGNRTAGRKVGSSKIEARTASVGKKKRRR